MVSLLSFKHIEMNDPNKYVVASTDFRRIPRWVNDGIEQLRHEIDLGENEVHPELTTSTSHPDQKALAELMGGWFFDQPLHEMGDGMMGRGFALSMPFMTQQQAAEDQSNLEQAKSHLIQEFKSGNNEIKNLLQQIGCKKLIYKASQYPRRFPDFKFILVPLFQKHLASDENIELLFGQVAHVRHLLLQIGTDMANPPPSNSPAGALLSQFQQSSKARVASQCAMCESEEGPKDNNKCGACKTVYYCSTVCQRKHWPVHKPDCLIAQGKPVPDSARDNAARTLAEWEESNHQQEAQERNEYVVKVQGKVTAFINESPSKVKTMSEDCYGNQRRAHLPIYGPTCEMRVAISMGLEVETELSLGFFPAGIPSTLSGRGLLVKDPYNTVDGCIDTAAKIMILHEKLFADKGNGNLDGYSLDGIFVVDSRFTKLRWTRVAEPTDPPHDWNRYERFWSYLEKAIREATAVSSSIDLEIHNPSDSRITTIPTVAGNFTQLGF